MSLGEQVLCPLPKRQELHTRPAGAALLHGARRSVADRFTLMSAGGSGVAAGAIAALLVAPVAVAASDTAGEDSGWVTSTEDSWVSLSSPSLRDTGEFAEAPAAASRARLREPVEVSSCIPTEGAANGSRTVKELQRVYFPMVAGTYQRSSSYGYRFHPVTGAYRMHTGTDFSAPNGTPIYSVMDGEVIEVTYTGGRGYYTDILHTFDDGTQVISRYMHQAYGSQIVSVGQQVEAGQQIGGVGSTGVSTGAHLHLEILNLDVETMDPAAWLSANNAIFIGEEECQ